MTIAALTAFIAIPANAQVVGSGPTDMVPHSLDNPELTANGPVLIKVSYGMTTKVDSCNSHRLRGNVNVRKIPPFINDGSLVVVIEYAGPATIQSTQRGCEDNVLSSQYVSTSTQWLYFAEGSKDVLTVYTNKRLPLQARYEVAEVVDSGSFND